jgi:hypothetical protein
MRHPHLIYHTIKIVYFWLILRLSLDLVKVSVLAGMVATFLLGSFSAEISWDVHCFVNVRAKCLHFAALSTCFTRHTARTFYTQLCGDERCNNAAIAAMAA